MGRVRRYKKIKAHDPFAKKTAAKAPRRVSAAARYTTTPQTGRHRSARAEAPLRYDLPPDEDQTGKARTGKALRRQERLAAVAEGALYRLADGRQRRGVRQRRARFVRDGARCERCAPALLRRRAECPGGGGEQ